MAKGYTFYAQVDRTELNKALHQIDFWDGKTRLKVEDAVSRGLCADNIAAVTKRFVNGST